MVKKRRYPSLLLHLVVYLLVLILPQYPIWAYPIRIRLVNDSGSNLFVQWVNPQTGELYDLHQDDDPSKPESITTYNTFSGDEFVVYESGDCNSAPNEEVCRRAMLQMPGTKQDESDSKEPEERVYVINSWFQLRHISNPREIQELFDDIQAKDNSKAAADDNPHAAIPTRLHIRNDSKNSFIDIYFVSNDDDSLIRLNEFPLLPSRVDPDKAQIGYNTFVGNRFELVETYGCADEQCRRFRVTVPLTKDGKDPGVLIEGDFQVTIYGGEEEEKEGVIEKKVNPVPEPDPEHADAVPVPKILSARKTRESQRTRTVVAQGGSSGATTTKERKDMTLSTTNRQDPKPTNEDDIIQNAKPPDFTKETWEAHQAKQRAQKEAEEAKKAKVQQPKVRGPKKKADDSTISIAKSTGQQDYTFRPASVANLRAPKLQDRYRRKALHSNIQATPTIVNYSGGAFDIYLVGPSPDSLIKLNAQGPLQPQTKFEFITLVYHEFEVRETGACQADTGNDWDYDDNKPVPTRCRRVRFRVGDKAPVITINDQYQAMLNGQEISSPKRQQIKLLNLLGSAEPFPARVLRQCYQESEVEFYFDDKHPLFVESVQECIEQIVADRIVHSVQEIQGISVQRSHFAPILEEYTCKDDTPTTTKPVNVFEWTHALQDHPQPRNVSVLLHRPTAKIHVIDNFVSDQECEFIERTRMGQYQYAMVADETHGGARVTQERRAQQAPLRIPWEREEKGQTFTKVGRRMYDYATFVMGVNFSQEGQEEPTLIKYEGKGFKDPQPEQYMAHCDGRCDGRQYVSGMRVATMIMYCAISEAGGHTNFRSSNIHIKPEKGSALFFTYVDPDSNRMDYGLTQHSGCPVYKGEKLIVTQWIRTGVDNNENKWYLFDEDGNKISIGQYREAMKSSFSAAVNVV